MAPRSRKKSQQVDLDGDTRIALMDIREKMQLAVADKKQVNEKLKAIQTALDKYKLNIGCKVTGTVRTKLTALYTEGEEALETEEVLLRNLQNQITQIHQKVYEAKRATSLKRGELMQLLVQRARFTPVWVSKADEHPPALVGAIPAPESMPLEVGWDVAAFVNNIWMLAEIVRSASGYEVKDLDDEQKDKKYAVRRSRMIPLPHWKADPKRDSHALFPANAVILALYPQTTCFYKGVVERVPETVTDGYMVAFEDAQFPQGYSPPLCVPQRYVVTYKTPRPYKRRKRNEY